MKPRSSMLIFIAVLALVQGGLGVLRAFNLNGSALARICSVKGC